MAQNPDDQQSVNIGITAPIVDWGRRKSSIRIAENNRQLEQLNLQEEKLAFDREIISRVKQFELLKIELEITKKSDEIAQKRYEIAKQRYLIGKTVITDLTIAVQEKDIARRDYINALRNFWTTYYQLRALTLYDFESNQIIVENN